jgi:pyruvate kinase
MVDANAQLVIVITSTGYAARMASKYRPAVPQVVVTADEQVANQVGRPGAEASVFMHLVEHVACMKVRSELRCSPLWRFQA